MSKLTILFGFFIGLLGAEAQAAEDHYAYGDARADALTAYHQGWHEILVNGRWGEAERKFREAAERDPDFIIGKALVGRITDDNGERKALLADINAGLSGVDADGRLILDIFILNIEAAVARAEGQTLPDGFSQKRAALALKNFRAFSEKYPGEEGILIEYLEWLHAIEGPQAALKAIEDVQKKYGPSTPFLTFFTAYLNAELGNGSLALEAARAFENLIGDKAMPQPYYLYAYVYHRAKQPKEAKAMIEKALDLDPKHLTAQALKSEIMKSLEGED